MELSLEFLADVLKTSPGELTDALKDGEEFKSQAEIEAHIRKVAEDNLFKAKQSGKTEGKNWGTKESLTAKEKELKAKFNVDGANLDEIIDNLIESAKQHSKLNPDDVKGSEVYINETKRLKALIAEKEAAIEKQASDFTKKETMRHAREYGMSILKKGNFVMPDDQDILDEAISNLFAKIEDENTQIKLEGDKILVLDANGKPKENETGTRELSFDDHLTAKAKRYFKQAVIDNRQSPANKNKPDQPPANPDMPEIANMNDLFKALNAERDPEKQKAIKAHYDKQVEDGVIK